MSSQSDASAEFAHSDEVSCGTYSSGWERSSTSEYWDSSSECDDEEEKHMYKEQLWQQPKRTGKQPTLADIEYKCELVVLPNPYRKINNNTIPVEQEEDVEEPQPTPQAAVVIVPVENPWKPVETTEKAVAEDPWKFLEEMNKPAEKERHARDRREDKRKTVSRPIDNSNTNKLCKYKDDCRMNKSNHCGMVHVLSAWKPRVCRFNNSCKRKTMCGYYHTNTPLTDYLRVMMNTPDTIYAKNSSLYEKYL